MRTNECLLKPNAPNGGGLEALLHKCNWGKQERFQKEAIQRALKASNSWHLTTQQHQTPSQQTTPKSPNQRNLTQYKATKTQHGNIQFNHPSQHNQTQNTMIQLLLLYIYSVAKEREEKEGEVWDVVEGNFR